MLFLNAIEPKTHALLKRLQALSELAETRLVGGTALALQKPTDFSHKEQEK